LERLAHRRFICGYMKRVNKALLEGTIYSSSEIDGWTVTWEGDEHYRHWCLQEKHGQEKSQILVVMLNPGSLRGGGENLRKDTTLRILRNVFSPSKYCCLVVNLFDFAGQPKDFFGNWGLRDKNSQLVYNSLLNAFHVKGAIFAYGDYENEVKEKISIGIKSRIYLVRETLSQRRIPIIDSPKNLSGTPMHPRVWQIKKKLDCVRNAIISHGL
jgi:hypothetical protein